MKNMVAMSAAALALLARLEMPLRRDVIFAAVADEEAGCALGSAWLVANHPDKVRAEYALGEGGGASGERPTRRAMIRRHGAAHLGSCEMLVRRGGAVG